MPASFFVISHIFPSTESSTPVIFPSSATAIFVPWASITVPFAGESMPNLFSTLNPACTGIVSVSPKYCAPVGITMSYLPCSKLAATLSELAAMLTEAPETSAPFFKTLTLAASIPEKLSIVTETLFALAGTFPPAKLTVSPEFKTYELAFGTIILSR